MKIKKGKALEPNGTVSFSLGTLGGAIGAGIYLQQVIKNDSPKPPVLQSQTTTLSIATGNNPPQPPTPQSETKAQSITSGAVTTTSVATTSASPAVVYLSADGTIGTAIGASSAVLGGIVAAVIIKRYVDNSGKVHLGFVVLGWLAGTIVGAGVGLALGYFGSDLGVPTGALLGGCVGLIAAIVDTVAF